MFWEMDFEMWRKGMRLRFGVLGYLGISSPISCVPVYIAELVQIFKQTHRSRNKRNSWLWTCRPRTQIQRASWAPALLPPFLLLRHLRLSPHNVPELLWAVLRPTRHLSRAGWGTSSRQWPGETSLSPRTCSARDLVDSEHLQADEVLWLKISASNSVWRNLDELVDNVVVWGDGYQINFTPAKGKVSSGACLGFQTSWVCLTAAHGAAALLAWGGRGWAAAESWVPFVWLVEDANNFTPSCPLFIPQCVFPASSSKVISFGVSGCCCQRMKNSSRNFWGWASAQRLKKFVHTWKSLPALPPQLGT